MSATQSPMEEMADRAAEAAPAAVLVPKLIAINDYRKSGSDYRKRVNDSYAAGMRLLGIDVGQPEGDDVSGDISVRGDTTVNNPIPPAMSGLTKGVMAAALLGSGAGAGILANQILPDDSQPSVAQPDDDDTHYELKLEGSEPIL